MSTSKTLDKIYKQLYSAFGPRNWWPGETPFEVVIGAILTQNTNWTNVEKAIHNLKEAKELTSKKLYEIDTSELAEHIRPSGYFNIKAKRIKNFINWLFKNYDGDLSKMFEQELPELRESLLSVNGIGPETADSILLYGGNKLTFVVDAYTHRIFKRHNLISEESTYDEIKIFFEENIPADVSLYNEFHALIVKLGSEYCKPKKRCEKCPLNLFLSDV